MCLNTPITIPVGADGKSCTVAYASDSSGTGFSYTPAEGLDYMSIVCKIGSISSTDFTSWSQYLGSDGGDGDNGISVTSATISDGVTAIGGTVYTRGNLIIGLSDGSYLDAGSTECCNITWIEFEPINGWTGKADAVGGFDPVYYAIDNSGFLHLRGLLFSSGATSANFMGDLLGGSVDALSVCSNWTLIAATPLTTQLTISPVSGGWLFQYTDSIYWNLDTMPPLYIV